MFIEEGYTLANEILYKKNINNANISMYVNFCQKRDLPGVIKRGSTVFIDLNQPHVFKYLKIKPEYTYENTFKNLWVKSEVIRTFDSYHVEIMKAFKPFNIEHIKICGKSFYKLDEKFMNETRDKIFATTSITEAKEMFKCSEICGYICLNKRRAIIYY